MQLPLVLPLRPSASLAAVLFLGHGLAVVALLACELPLLVKMALIGLIAISGVFSLRHHALYLKGPESLVLRQDGKLDLMLGAGITHTLQVLPQSVVHVWGVVLRLHADDQRMTLILLPDALGSECHRKLRVWLSWQAGKS